MKINGFCFYPPQQKRGFVVDHHRDNPEALRKHGGSGKVIQAKNLEADSPVF